MTLSCSRWHEIDCGHRVVGQGGKCEMIHGHRYRIEFHARTETPTFEMDQSVDTEELNEIGMIIDFGIIKEKLCGWLDENWDHRYLCYDRDPLGEQIMELDLGAVFVDFNPTAENIADHLLRIVAQEQLADTGVEVWKVVVHETLKCHAEATL